MFVPSDFVAKRCFSQGTVIKIVSDELPKATADTSVTITKSEESVKPVEEGPKEKKEQQKTKKSSFRPFMYGCVITILAGYYYVYRQIWKSAHQMEQSIADLNVDVSEKVDHLNQRVARLESLNE